MNSEIYRVNTHTLNLILCAISNQLFVGKERERRLIECRKTAEERKNYFESMERHMFARGSTAKETGRESISTSQEQVCSFSKCMFEKYNKITHP